MSGPTSGDPHVRKHFGYARISWKVQHFWLFTCRRNWEVCSPDFEVQTTRWRMVLKPMVNPTSTHLCAYLERLCSYPDTVRANWKVRMVNCKGNQRSRLFREMEHLFQKNGRYGEVIDTMECLPNDFEPFELDNLLVECYLIVSRPEASPERWRDDEALVSLSDDMHALFRSGRSSDLVIRVGSNDIPAVRAVLHARNPTLAHIIDSDREARVIPLLADQRPADTGWSSSSAFNLDAVERVVCYLHCGKLEEVVSRPSVSVAECALLLDVVEVSEHYVPDELTFTSGVEVEENVVTWFVSELEERDVYCIASPPLIVGSQNRAISKLRLYPSGRDGTGDHVSLYAEMLGDVAVAVCLEFAIADSEEKFHCFRRLRKSQGESVTCLGVEDFFERSRIGFAPFQGTLRVVFRFRTSTGVPTLSGVQRSVTPVAASFPGRHLKALSEDLEDLLWNDSGFGDFTIRCSGGYSFRVHRAMLDARARAIPAATEELDLSHVSTDVLRVLLSHVYSGVPKGFVPEMAPDLFQIASYFGFEALWLDLRAKCNVANNFT